MISAVVMKPKKSIYLLPPPLIQFQHCDVCLHCWQMAGGAGASVWGLLCSGCAVAARGEGRRGQLSAGGSEGVFYIHSPSQ